MFASEIRKGLVFGMDPFASGLLLQSHIQPIRFRVSSTQFGTSKTSRFNGNTSQMATFAPPLSILESPEVADAMDIQK